MFRIGLFGLVLLLGVLGPSLAALYLFVTLNGRR